MFPKIPRCKKCKVHTPFLDKRGICIECNINKKNRHKKYKDPYMGYKLVD